MTDITIEDSGAVRVPAFSLRTLRLTAIPVLALLSGCVSYDYREWKPHKPIHNLRLQVATVPAGEVDYLCLKIGAERRVNEEFRGCSQRTVMDFDGKRLAIHRMIIEAPYRPHAGWFETLGHETSHGVWGGWHE